MNASRDCITHKMDVSKALDADFTFPKINLISDLVEQICRYGALPQYSTARHQQAHNMNLKVGWNASNHNINYLPQVITFQHHILCFEKRELNLHALAQRRENNAAACKVVPFGADLAAPLSAQSYAEPQFMGPQNRRVGKHPDAMIKDPRALLNPTQDAAHWVAIYGGTPEFIKHKSHHRTYMLDEQQHALELSIDNGVYVPVVRLEGKYIPQMCRCTGSQSWCRGDPRNDRV